MGITRKFWFIFLNLLLCSGLALAGKAHSVLPADPEPLNPVSFSAFCKPAATVPGSSELEDKETLLFSVTTIREETAVKKVAKLRKKFKRTLPSSSNLRTPVREIEIIPANIYIKETYSKPFFLSPLHRFLFRLTPF